jgi:hypothetical protein
VNDQGTGHASLLVGGPWHRLLGRLGLLASDELPGMRAALLSIALAWTVPAMLCVASGTAWNIAAGERSFLLDPAVHVRFGVAILLLVILERGAEQRITALLGQFAASGLIPPAALPVYRAALRRAARRSTQAAAEYAALVLAFIISFASVGLGVATLGSSWMGRLVDGSMALSPAGWWGLLVSFPLFWFLVLRWLWRFIVGARLLRELSRASLQLQPSHPDGCAGLGFLGQFPATFLPLAFAMSCVAAATAFKAIVYENLGMKFIVAFLLTWLALVALTLIGPLATFASPLRRTRRDALLDYGALLAQHNRAFEQKWIKREYAGGELLGAGDVSSMADFAAVYDQVRSVRLLPADRRTLVSVMVVCSLPWLPAFATLMPLVDMLKMMSKAFL